MIELATSSQLAVERFRQLIPRDSVQARSFSHEAMTIFDHVCLTNLKPPCLGTSGETSGRRNKWQIPYGATYGLIGLVRDGDIASALA
jgi:hypothetical protein